MSPRLDSLGCRCVGARASIEAAEEVQLGGVGFVTDFEQSCGVAGLVE